MSLIYTLKHCLFRDNSPWGQNHVYTVFWVAWEMPIQCLSLGEIVTAFACYLLLKNNIEMYILIRTNVYIYIVSILYICLMLKHTYIYAFKFSDSARVWVIQISYLHIRTLLAVKFSYIFKGPTTGFFSS